VAKEIIVQNIQVATPAMYHVKVVGVQPLIMNKMPDFFKSLEVKTKSKPKKMSQEDQLLSELEHWKEKAYVRDSGKLYIPGDNIQRCLFQGAQYANIKIPGAGNKKFADVIKSACIIYDCDLDRTESDLIQYRRAVNRGLMKRSMVGTIRPMLASGWTGTFDIQIFDGRLIDDTLSTIITYAGLFKGLGDLRPRFGRFELRGLEIE